MYFRYVLLRKNNNLLGGNEMKKLLLTIVVTSVLGAICSLANGATWQPMDSGTTEDLRDIWGFSKYDVYAVGHSGTILHRDSIGQWSKMTSPTSNHLKGVWGYNSEDVWAVGENGTILRRQNGNDWQQISGISSNLHLNSIWGTGLDNIYAVGEVAETAYGNGVLLRWDGQSWTSPREWGPMQFNDVWGRTSTNEVFVIGHSHDIGFTEGICYKFTSEPVNGAWQTDWPKTSSFYAIWGTGDELFIASQAQPWAAEVDHYNGAVWNSQNFGDHALMGVWGTAGNNVYVVGYEGKILRYNGDVWTNMDSGTTVILSDIWGSGPDDVFVTGYNGTILRLSDPIEEILDFIDESVGNGTLVPVKPGKAGQGQLGALINMIEAAGNLIDADDPNLLADACTQLQDALEKTDGLAPPESAPDFVTGPAASELAVMIEVLMDSLGCDSSI